MITHSCVETLSDVFNKPGENGVFKSMLTNDNLSTLFSSINLNTDNVQSIDFDYIYNRSGNKAISELLYNMIYNRTQSYRDLLVVDEVRFPTWNYLIMDVGTELVNSLLYVKFFDKWTKLIDTVLLKYDILNPLNITLSETAKNTDTNSGSDSYTSSASGTIKDSGSGSTKHEINETDSRSIYGYNSSSASPSDIVNSIGDNSDSTSTENNRTTSASTSDKQTFGRVLTVNSTRNHTRIGSIGNKTFSELVDSERNTATFVILDTIYRDLDSVLTRGRYI